MRRINLAVLAAALLAGALASGTSTAAADTTCAKTIAIGNAQASEGAGEIRFPVTVSAPIGCALIGSVQFSTVSLPIPNPAGVEDYTAKFGQVTWSAPGSGPGQRWITIALKQNSDAEKNELFGVSLHGETGATVSDGLAVGTIVDDDPVATLPQPAPLVTSTPRCIVVLTVTLSAPAATAMTVGWETVDGTATAGNDFLGVTDGQFTIAQGAVQGGFSVSVYPNQAGEPEESFDVRLTGVTPGRLGSAQIHLIIPPGWGL